MWGCFATTTVLHKARTTRNSLRWADEERSADSLLLMQIPGGLPAWNKNQVTLFLLILEKQPVMLRTHRILVIERRHTMLVFSTLTVSRTGFWCLVQIHKQPNQLAGFCSIEMSPCRNFLQLKVPCFNPKEFCKIIFKPYMYNKGVFMGWG